MTIGKRKGFTAKGAGAAPGNDANKKVEEIIYYCIKNKM